MPAFSSLNTSALVASARALSPGVRDTPDALSALADYGYTASDVDAGLDLVESAEDEAGHQQAEYAEQYAATEAAQTAVAEMEALFVRHRTLARLAHARGSDGYRGLGLTGRLPGRAPELVAAASTFYRALSDTPALATGVRGLAPAAVADGLARVKAARASMDAQSRETGEAQQATAAQDAAVVRLRAHASEMARVATLALGDRPQLRESLGLLERGA